MEKKSGTVTLVGGPCAGYRVTVEDVRYPVQVAEMPEFLTYWAPVCRIENSLVCKDHLYPTMPMANERGDVTYIGRQNGTDVIRELLDFYADQNDRLNEGHRQGRLALAHQILRDLERGMPRQGLIGALQEEIERAAHQSKGEKP